MSCRFRGSFSSEEKECLEKAARAVERFLSRDAEGRPAWAFLHFDVPYDGHPYWGVRFGDGFRVGGETVEEIAAALDGLRTETLQRQKRIRRGRTRRKSRPDRSSMDSPIV